LPERKPSTIAGTPSRKSFLAFSNSKLQSRRSVIFLNTSVNARLVRRETSSTISTRFDQRSAIYLSDTEASLFRNSPWRTSIAFERSHHSERYEPTFQSASLLSTKKSSLPEVVVLGADMIYSFADIRDLAAKGQEGTATGKGINAEGLRCCARRRLWIARNRHPLEAIDRCYPQR
jgi:hypothetical protein